MAFEVFKETGARPKEFISITEKMAFGMSRAFLNRYSITSDHKAVILYDAEANKVALHFSLREPKFSFSVRISNPKHGAIVVARSFFERKNIDAKRYAGRYGEFEVVSLRDLGLDSDGKAFVITLKENDGEEASDEVAVEDINERPIDLSEIPF